MSRGDLNEAGLMPARISNIDFPKEIKYLLPPAGIFGEIGNPEESAHSGMVCILVLTKTNFV